MNPGALRLLIEDELRQPPAPAVAALAARLAGRAPGRVAAILFYGSALRSGELDGLLDFYLLLDDVGDWPAARLATLANRMLPPNVGYLEERVDGAALRAKYAVLSARQFRRGMSASSCDTTLWARFSQPCACVFARAPADEAAAIEAVCQAVATAAHWAARLGPERAPALDYWRALYARTYGAELRVESGLRGPGLADSAAARYARLLPLAWDAAGIAFDAGSDGSLRPRLTARERARAARGWGLRRRLGRPLNFLRLAKSSFTFDGAMDYVVWKVERHSGVRLEVKPWQRRHPLLAAPWLYRRLRKLGLLN